MTIRLRRTFRKTVRLFHLNNLKVVVALCSLLVLLCIVGMLGTISNNVIQLLDTVYKGSFVSRIIFDISASSVINGMLLRRKAISFRDYKRDLSCNDCFKHDFKYVINNENVCQLRHPGQQIDLFIIVFTQHEHWRARQALRKTWLSYSNNNTAHVRHVFLLGEVHNDRYRRWINKENRIYHDIVKEDFLDVYMNLTYKTIMGLKVATSYCNHASFVLKTDDDVFINIPHVLRLLGQNGSTLQTAVGGACTKKQSPIRTKYSKWYASVDSFPGNRYPDFCSGTAYITSMRIAREVYAVSPHVPFFHLEDVYVGLCIEKLGYIVVDFPGFLTDDIFIFDMCAYKKKSVFSVHNLIPVKIFSIWFNKC